MLKIIKEYPSKTQYVHQETDYDCLLIKNEDSTYGIFVGLPPRHLYWKESFERINKEHGFTLDYSSFCTHTNEETGVCHVGIPDKKTRVWWVGYINTGVLHQNSVLYVLKKLSNQLKELES